MEHCADKQAFKVAKFCKGRVAGVEEVKFVKTVIFLFFCVFVLPSYFFVYCCLFVEYGVNQHVLCYAGGKVFEAIVMSPFVDAGRLFYYVFSRTSPEPIVAKLIELPYHFCMGKKVDIVPGVCEVIPIHHQELWSEAVFSYHSHEIQIKQEFPIGKKVNTF